MKPLLSNRLVLVILTLLLFMVFGFVMFFLGNRYALEHLSLKTVTPNELAKAMRQDNFYSTYRENTLLINGQVSSTKIKGSSVVMTLKTFDSYGLDCVVNNILPQIQVARLNSNATLLFLAEAYQAQRLPHGVQINCWQL